MIERIIVVIVVVTFGFVAVSLWERRPGRRRRVGVPPGVTVVTGADCRMCPQAIAALDRSGVRSSVVDVSDVPHLGILSVPTVLVVAADGSVVLRRSGRSAITDAPSIAAAAVALAGVNA